MSKGVGRPAEFPPRERRSIFCTPGEAEVLRKLLRLKRKQKKEQEQEQASQIAKQPEE